MLTERLRLAIHGLSYGVQVAGDGPPLLLLHGFTGSASVWTPHLRAFAAHFRTVCVDLPGHGATDAPADLARYGMAPVVADLLAIVDQVAPHPPAPSPSGGRGGGRVRGWHRERATRERVSVERDVPSDTHAVALTPLAPDGSPEDHASASHSISPSPAAEGHASPPSHAPGAHASSPSPAHWERGPGGEGFSLLGYSMGGRIALHLALAAPERVRALVLESASPGLADPAERTARRAADWVLADRIEREGLDAFVRYWEALPLFAAQARLQEEVRARQRAQRLASDPRGLANSLRGAGAGMQESLWDRLDGLTMPVLLLTGSLDGKYEGIATEMASHLPHAQRIAISNAGHTPHLEQPDAFSAAVVPWLLEHATGCPT